MKHFECIDECNIPEDFQKALNEGKDFEVHTAVGWIPVEIDYFRCGCLYKISQDDE